MASREVEFHQDASLEYEAAFEWYFERSEQAALRFALELDHGVALIAEAPQRWPMGIQNTRRFLLQRFPFAVVYRQLPGVIQVLAVAHTRRRPGYWKKRISGSSEEPG
jgi:toxin ParE1/3/4